MNLIKSFKFWALCFLVWLTFPYVAVAQNSWQAPQPGWLYVLDAGAGGEDGHLLLIDPVKEVVAGSIAIGVAPEFAVTADGSKIFVVSGSVDQGKIAVYDGRSGQSVAHAELERRVLYTTWPQSATVAVYSDGRWLFVETMQTIAPGIDDYNVLRFEVSKTGITPAGKAALPECGIAKLIPTTDRELLVYCNLGNVIRHILFDTDGTVSKYTDLDLPTRPFDPASGQMEHRPLTTRSVVYRGTGDDVIALMRSNELCHLNLLDGTGPCSSLGSRMNGRWIPERAWPHSADGRFIYLGSGPVVNRSQGSATSIEIVDVETMTFVSSINVSVPFRTLGIDLHGERLYAANPATHMILQIDLNSKKEIKEISMAPFFPAVIVPVP